MKGVRYGRLRTKNQGYASGNAEMMMERILSIFARFSHIIRIGLPKTIFGFATSTGRSFSRTPILEYNLHGRSLNARAAVTFPPDAVR
jgi:hypothetical protein